MLLIPSEGFHKRACWGRILELQCSPEKLWNLLPSGPRRSYLGPSPVKSLMEQGAETWSIVFHLQQTKTTFKWMEFTEKARDLWGSFFSDFEIGISQVYTAYGNGRVCSELHSICPEYGYSTLMWMDLLAGSTGMASMQYPFMQSMIWHCLSWKPTLKQEAILAMTAKQIIWIINIM